MNSHYPNRRPFWLFAALLLGGFCTLAAVFYLPALQSFFHADDFVLLEAVQKYGPFGIWSDRKSAFLRPIISLSLYVDGRLWGLNPLGFHAANVLVHTLNALLVAAIFPILMDLLIKMNRSDSSSTQNVSGMRRGAVFSGLLFLLQPTHPEAVTWVSGRTDVYAAFFCLSTFFFYLRFRDRGDTGDTGGYTWLLGALLLYGFSLLCKESAILFPLVIVAFEVFRARCTDTVNSGRGSKNKVRNIVSRAWPFFAVVALYLLLRVYILGTLIGGYGSAHTKFGVVQLVQSTLWFFCSAFLPLLPRWSYCFAVLALLGVAVIFRLRQGGRAHPALGFLLVAFSLASAPVLNLGGGPAPNGMSGRLVYLASSFAALAVVLLVDFLIPHRRAASTALVALTVVWGAQLYFHNLTWLRAGQIAQQCIADLAPVAPPRPVVVLAAPDNLYPAFILRNGLPEALQLFHPSSPSAQNRIDLVSTIPLYDVDGGVTVDLSRTGEVHNQRTFDLVATNPPARIGQAGFTLNRTTGTAYRAEVISNARLRVTLTEAPWETAGHNTRYFVFSQGRLKLHRFP